ncbi:MAG: hypothetical protein NXI13_16480 [Proteobacteria bacterium]|nr:hypothetical protein [Pseudomonadota bacterium]
MDRKEHERLEALIDAAGRQDVFAVARYKGWTDAGAPPYVYESIANKIIHTRAQEFSKEMHGTVKKSSYKNAQKAINSLYREALESKINPD